MSKIFISAILIILATYPLSAQDKNINDYVRDAMAAYQQHDYETFLDNIRTLHDMNPHSPNIMYNMACGYALTGRGDSALMILNTLADDGIDFGAANDGDFASVKNTAKFAEIMKKLARNTESVSSSIKVISLPDNDIMIEGITYDKVGRKFYFGSMNKRDIYILNNLGRLEMFKKPGEDGLAGVTGMEVDPLRRIIWVCSNMAPFVEGYEADGPLTGEVIKFDLEKGMVLGRYPAPNDGRDHSLNDVAIQTSTGDVYVTDDRSGAIYKIDYNKDKLSEFKPAGAFYSPNGIAISDDEKYLYIAAYGDGVYRVALDDGKAVRIPDPKDGLLFGIDGLYFYKNSLVAIQNGYNPDRVMRYFLNKAGDAVSDTKKIEFGSALIDDPTTGVIVNGDLYYIGMSGMENFDNTTWKMKPDSLCIPARILKAALK